MSGTVDRPLEAEAVTDCAREAGGEATSLYFGVFNFVVKAANGLAILLTGLLIKLARQPGYEWSAVRAMGVLAGALLVLGGGLYLWLRRTGSSPAPPSNTSR